MGETKLIATNNPSAKVKYKQSQLYHSSSLRRTGVSSNQNSPKNFYKAKKDVGSATTREFVEMLKLGERNLKST